MEEGIQNETASVGPLADLWRRQLSGRAERLLHQDHELTQRVLCAGRSVLFAPDAVVRTFWRRAPCALTLLPPTYFPVSTSYPTRRGFPYLPHIDYALMRMMETGVWKYLLEHYLPPLRPQQAEAQEDQDEDEDTEGEGLQQAALLAVGAASSLAVLALEWALWLATRRIPALAWTP